MKPSISIEIEIDEFWFLLQKFAPAVVVGVENPYPGWLIEEIKAKGKGAVLSLSARNLAHTLSETEVSIDEALAAMVGTCARPEHTLIVQSRTTRGGQAHAYVHFREGLIVIHVPVDRRKHLLSAVGSREDLVENLSDALRLRSEAEGVGNPFEVDETSLFQARDCCARGDKKEAITLLERSGMEKMVAENLAEVLSRPVANSTVVAIVHRAERGLSNIRGFALLEGSGQMWVMTPFERNEYHFVRFVPSKCESIREEFIRVLPQ